MKKTYIITAVLLCILPVFGGTARAQAYDPDAAWWQFKFFRWFTPTDPYASPTSPRAPKATDAIPSNSALPKFGSESGLPDRSSQFGSPDAQKTPGNSSKDEKSDVPGPSNNVKETENKKSDTPPPPSGSATDGTSPPIAAGGHHSCAVRAPGLQCWGENISGQLGNGANANSAKPVLVVDDAGKPLPEITGLAAGKAHSCALLKKDGAVSCWGQNDKGQLGDGTTTNRNKPAAVVVAGGILVNATGITAGDSHSCALMKSGAVWCWGKNDLGQLGDGSNKDSLTPAVALGADGKPIVDAIAVSAGKNHTCALLQKDGSIKCWGDNGANQLGVGSVNSTNMAMSVIDSEGKTKTGFAALAAGGSHTCAVSSKGNLFCWGYNNNGQLGMSKTTKFAEVPTAVVAVDGTELGNIKTVSAGGYHTCAIRTDGKVLCFGKGASGQLGDGAFDTKESPVPVKADAVSAISAGLNHSCAVVSEGKKVMCWGDNNFGQLGIGAKGNQNSPIEVLD